MIVLEDAVSQDILLFLEACEEYGKDIPTVGHVPLFQAEPWDAGKHTVAWESRRLKHLFKRVCV